MRNYNEHWKDVQQTINKCAVDVTWAQWVALGSLARPSATTDQSRIIDPEALVLLSLAFREQERRLEDLTRWWANVGSPFTSVQRMKTIAENMNHGCPENFYIFARFATEFGHRRWNRYAGSSPYEQRDEAAPTPFSAEASSDSLPGPGPLKPNLEAPSAMILRLRAAFGISAKPDILAYLIGCQDVTQSVSAISRAVGYTKTAVRDALKDMLMAGLVKETIDRPAVYKTDYMHWLTLLGIRPPIKRDEPRWCMWASLFGFLIAARDVANAALNVEQSDYVAASAARDVFEKYAFVFRLHDISLPRISEYNGRKFSEAFSTTVRSVCLWIEQGPRSET